MRLLIAAVLAAALFPATASARPGDLDRSFGNGGRAAVEGSSATLVHVAAKGRIVYSDGEQRLAALDRRGRATTRFASTRASHSVVSDGRVVRLGRDHLVDGSDRWYLERFDARGRLPGAAVEVQGMPPSMGLSWLLPAQDGSVLAVMRTEGDQSAWRTAVVRVDPAGVAAPVVTAELPRLDVGRAGGFADGGGFISVGLLPQRLRALDAAGALVAGFEVPLPAGALDILALPDGGAFVATGDADRGSVLRISSTGAVLRQLDVPGMPWTLARDGRGRLLVGYTSGTDPLAAEARVRRYTRAGAPDRRFGRGGTATIPPRRGHTGVQLGTLLADRADRVLVAVTDHRAGGPFGVTSRPAIARLHG